MKQKISNWLQERCVAAPPFHPDHSQLTGMFRIEDKAGTLIHVIASDGSGWEHVSVSISGAERCPTWGEMCLVKDLFWHKNETVIQYHPSEKTYVNNHPYVLHLWRPTGKKIPNPPTILIGLKERPPVEMENGKPVLTSDQFIEILADSEKKAGRKNV